MPFGEVPGAMAVVGLGDNASALDRMLGFTGRQG